MLLLEGLLYFTARTFDLVDLYTSLSFITQDGNSNRPMKHHYEPFRKNRNQYNESTVLANRAFCLFNWQVTLAFQLAGDIGVSTVTYAFSSLVQYICVLILFCCCCLIDCTQNYYPILLYLERFVKTIHKKCLYDELVYYFV